VDKIREELEMGYKEHAIKEFEYAGWLKDGKYNDDMQVHDLWKAYKSRDKEIHRLEQIATENSDWFDALKIDFNKKKEEIKKLSEKNEYLKAVLKIIAKYQYQTASKGALLLSGWAEQALEDVNA